MSARTDIVRGDVEEGYGPVADAFAHNFDEGREKGAAFALYAGGSKVVDVWGGVADTTTGRPWDEDTLQLVFSSTKGATATCVHKLVEDGRLDLDAPVASYWPEFAAAGKERVPVRWLLSHRVGLPALDERITPEAFCDGETAARLLAAQEPAWEPGTAHGYHAITYGTLLGEVVRRVTGESLGAYFRREVADPLGLEFWIGLPEELEPRVSRLEGGVMGSGDTDAGTAESLRAQLATVDLDTLPQELRAFLDPDSLTWRSLSPTEPSLQFNSRMVHAAELGAASGITTARSLAKLYASLVGEVDGVRTLSKATVDAAREVQSEGRDQVLMVENRIALGYWLDCPFSPMLGAGSFGHAGAGGSLGLGDVDAEVGYGYVMNHMDTNIAGDPRTVDLLAAVRACLG
jgi:CubicO group peptidase (beta-lactamase class C family)